MNTNIHKKNVYYVGFYIEKKSPMRIIV